MSNRPNNRSEHYIDMYMEQVGEFREIIDDIIALISNYEESSSYFIHSLLLRDNIVSQNSSLIPTRFRSRSLRAARTNRNFNSARINTRNSNSTSSNISNPISNLTVPSSLNSSNVESNTQPVNQRRRVNVITASSRGVNTTINDNEEQQTNNIPEPFRTSSRLPLSPPPLTTLPRIQISSAHTIRPSQMTQQNISETAVNTFLNSITPLLSRNRRDNLTLGSLSPVPIAPSVVEIDRATEIVHFSNIENPMNSRCPITMNNFGENDRVIQIIHCGHCFNRQALLRWFSDNTVCPVCRYDIREYTPLNAIRNPYRRNRTNIQERIAPQATRARTSPFNFDFENRNEPNNETNNVVLDDDNDTNEMDITDDSDDNNDNNNNNNDNNINHGCISVSETTTL